MKKIIFIILIIIIHLNTSIFAFSVRSGINRGCHEEFLTYGYTEAQLLEHSNIPYPPEGTTWDTLSKNLLPIQLNDIRERFYYISLIIGVRAPDTDGHSNFNIAALRQAAVYPDEQYNHFLRAQNDDYTTGELNAYNRIIARIREVLGKGREYFDKPQSEQIVTVKVTLDYYNEIDVRVWAPAYYMGYALHMIHDSYSHTVRSTASGYKEIVHILNYAEAIYGNWDERRDGLRHASKMDKCNEDTVIVSQAKEATKNFLNAVHTAIESGDYANMNTFFTTYMTYIPGTNYDNNYNNEEWAAYIKKYGDEPYIESLFGCNLTGKGKYSKAVGLYLLFFYVIIISIAFLRKKILRMNN